MNCHIMVYVRIVLTTLTIISCLLGDSFVELTQHPLLKALADNATHALIGAMTGIAFTVQFHDKIGNLFGWLLIFLCFLCSSLIDVDHFIEARSFNLEDATNLTRRPFLHCSSIIGILCIFYMCTACFNYMKTCLILGILICAFFTHHTRDALRRGYWLCPFGHTGRISQMSYIVLTVFTPYIVSYLYTLCRTALVQRVLAKYIQLSENNIYRPEYRYLHV